MTIIKKLTWEENFAETIINDDLPTLFKMLEIIKKEIGRRKDNCYETSS
ncbi:hypothetical protein HY498_05050 [Candidatus Woesearchaeota archaeon]|nr:hypothetical protein [Candidatus Woesearchaeota archaeon]